tara:strand:- start:18 stop:662 length:645 start_codon:yes stop_codon:yes gene_type:complete
MKISYALTVCNEDKELDNLINHISPLIRKEDEIVIVYDQNRITEEVHQVLNKNKDKVKFFPFNFQQNFLENKNYLGTKCSGDFIFQIDADEIPHENLIKSLPPILTENQNVDVFLVPRVNLVKGLTNYHIQKWGWRVNEKNWINWPDQQKRIYKNSPEIQWSGHQIHGMVEGYKTITSLPLVEEFSIYHNKTVSRQEQQVKRYQSIDSNLKEKI